MDNPYQSPPSPASEVAQPPCKRPISLWLLLLLLGPLTIALTVSAARLVWIVIAFAGVIDVRLAGILAWRFAVLALVAGALLGVMRRRQWGRWLGVLVLVALASGLYFLPGKTDYLGSNGGGNAFNGSILTAALMTWWIYACGFSRKARRYFAK